MSGALTTRSLSAVLGVSLCGLTGYLLYLLFKKSDDDDDIDDYISTVPRCADHRTLRVSVPKEMVRALIGRNGTNIKSIQAQTNTRISFRDTSNEGDERECVIRGPSEACNMAEHLIYEFLSTQPVYECISIWVPQQAVGKIIGRCGEVIQEICSTTGAFVKVSDDDKKSATRRIILKGTTDQIKLANSFIDDIVDRHNTSKSLVDSTLSRREPRLPSRSNSTTPTGPPSSQLPRAEKIAENASGQGQIEVYVSAMMDPSHFWLQIVGPKAAKLDGLVEEMTEYYTRGSNRDCHVVESLNVGDLVAACFQYDNKWYRAEVLRLQRPEIPENSPESSDNMVELYYVDYGDTDWVRCEDVFELRTDFLRLHFQAIECYLAGIEPISATTGWSEDAVDKFEEWTHVAQWKRLTGRMHGCVTRDKIRARREGSPVPGVDLFDVDVDIGRELVRHGYAVPSGKTAELGVAMSGSMTSNATSGSNASLNKNNGGVVRLEDVTSTTTTV